MDVAGIFTHLIQNAVHPKVNQTLARKKTDSIPAYTAPPAAMDPEAYLPVSGMYENWFLEYASYVILERAVPALGDGLKPVQRRILHAMEVIDDGRFNKVANLIGQTMQYLSLIHI